MNPLSLLGGGVNAAAIAAVVLSLGAGAAGIYHGIQQAAINRVALQDAQQAAKERAEADQRTIDGLRRSQALAAGRSASNTAIKEALRGQATSTACLGSPAGAAFLRVMRSNGGRDLGAAPAPAAGNVAVQPPAGAAGR